MLPATRQRWHSCPYPSRSWYSTKRPRRDARLSWPSWLVTYRDGIPARGRSPVPVLTGQHSTTATDISVVCYERRMSRWSVRVCDWSVYWGSILLLRRSRRLWRLVRRTTRLQWAISIRIFRNIRYDVSFRKLCLDYDVMIDRDFLRYDYILSLNYCVDCSLSVLSVFIFYCIFTCVANKRHNNNYYY